MNSMAVEILANAAECSFVRALYKGLRNAGIFTQEMLRAVYYVVHAHADCTYLKFKVWS